MRVWKTCVCRCLCVCVCVSNASAPVLCVSPGIGRCLDSGESYVQTHTHGKQTAVHWEVTSNIRLTCRCMGTCLRVPVCVWVCFLLNVYVVNRTSCGQRSLRIRPAAATLYRLCLRASYVPDLFVCPCVVLV